MNFLFWKNNKLIDSFSSDLANELYSNVQPEFAAQLLENTKVKKQVKKEKKFSNELQIIIKKINEFKHVNKIGVYGKARLHLKFRLRLEELGYDAKIAKKLNEFIMVKTP